MTNLKMEHSGLVGCPEVEQLRPCSYFGTCTTSKAHACYAELLMPMRKQTSKKCTHQRTPDKGVIRLGTYLEITPKLWAAFKAFTGVAYVARRRAFYEEADWLGTEIQELDVRIMNCEAPDCMAFVIAETNLPEYYCPTHKPQAVTA